MAALTLHTYRRKSINAYLVLEGTQKFLFGKPIDGDSDKAHAGKLHQVCFDLGSLDNGIYLYQCAGGADFNKVVKGWIKIVSGEVVDEGEGKPPSHSALFMPELIGTPKQVAWAESIRSKAVAKHGAKTAGTVAKRTDAKWWIDNRDRM